MPVQSFEKCASEECSQKLTHNNSVAASEQDDNASVVAKHCNFELLSDSTSLSSDLSDQKAASTTLDPSTRNDLNPIKYHKGLLGGSTTPDRIKKKTLQIDPRQDMIGTDRIQMIHLQYQETYPLILMQKNYFLMIMTFPKLKMI